MGRERIYWYMSMTQLILWQRNSVISMGSRISWRSCSCIRSLITSHRSRRRWRMIRHHNRTTTQERCSQKLPTITHLPMRINTLIMIWKERVHPSSMEQEVFLSHTPWHHIHIIWTQMHSGRKAWTKTWPIRINSIMKVQVSSILIILSKWRWTDTWTNISARWTKQISRLLMRNPGRLQRRSVPQMPLFMNDYTPKQLLSKKYWRDQYRNLNHISWHLTSSRTIKYRITHSLVSVTMRPVLSKEDQEPSKELRRRVNSGRHLRIMDLIMVSDSIKRDWRGRRRERDIAKRWRSREIRMRRRSLPSNLRSMIYQGYLGGRRMNQLRIIWSVMGRRYRRRSCRRRVNWCLKIRESAPSTQWSTTTVLRLWWRDLRCRVSMRTQSEDTAIKARWIPSSTISMKMPRRERRGRIRSTLPVLIQSALFSQT